MLTNFLAASIVSILVIRFYLHLSHYPQIGGGGLHIAHMLWGGLFLLLAFIMLLVFFHKTTRLVAAILGGIGFGTFIDELGKFITHDNNYFFQPTIALIYVIFILLYLLFQLLQRHQYISDETYIVNTLESLKQIVIQPKNYEDVNRAKHYLAHIHKKTPVTISVNETLTTIQAEEKKHLLSRIHGRIHQLYIALIRSKTFGKIFVGFFILQAVITVLLTIVFTTVLVTIFTGQFSFLEIEHVTFTEIGDFLSSLLAGIFVFIGIIKLFRSQRLAAYKFFRISVLISLFLTQFFLFYDVQFQALYTLTINIFILMTLNFFIEQEMSVQKASVMS